MATRLIFGCGYLGRRVAERWVAAGDRVVAVTRSKKNAEAFSTAGIESLVANVTLPETLTQLPESDTLLFAVGYDRSADASIHEVYAEGFARVLEAVPAATQRVVYISTTGVYGDADGDWVDEQTPPAPSRDGGKASLAAEQVLAASPWGDRSSALRLAGIYGPDRLPYLAKLKAGEPLAASPGGWLNLVHVDDAATATLAAADAASAHAVVCVSDGSPPLRADYYAEVARWLGAPTPTFVDPPSGSPRAARATASKRVRNTVLTGNLCVQLAYPTYREGLAAILAE